VTNRRYSKEQLAAMHAKRGGGRFAGLKRKLPGQKTLRDSARRLEKLRGQRAEVLGAVDQLSSKWSSLTAMPRVQGEPSVYAKGRKGKMIRVGSEMDVQRSKTASAIGFKGRALERLDRRIANEQRGRKLVYGALAAGVLAPAAGVALFKTQAGRRMLAKGLVRFRPLAPAESALDAMEGGIEKMMVGRIEGIEEQLKRKLDDVVTRGADRFLGGAARYNIPMEEEVVGHVAKKTSHQLPSVIRRRRSKVGGVEQAVRMQAVENLRKLGKVEVLPPGRGMDVDASELVDINKAMRNTLAQELNESSVRRPGYIEKADDFLFRNVTSPIARKLGIPVGEKHRVVSANPALERSRSQFETSAELDILQSRGARMIRGDEGVLRPGETARGRYRRIGRRKLEWRPPVQRTSGVQNRALMQTQGSASGKARTYEGKVEQVSAVDVRLQAIRSNERKTVAFADEYEKLRSIPRELLSPRARARLEQLEKGAKSR
jgi:hypothetical protein